MKILADSINAATRQRIITFEATFPRCILAELNTHRTLSRNSASSRAIPVAKQIEKVLADPFIPVHWGKNQKGMQADVELTPEEQAVARAIWLDARDMAAAKTQRLAALAVHKQIANRLLEPFMWHTAIITATERVNFYNLRTDGAAEPHFQILASMMCDAEADSTPVEVQPGAWHLPLVRGVDYDELRKGYDDVELARICSARCGRVSYLTHDGKRDPTEDLALADRLQKPGHMSPFEHAAQAVAKPVASGNFHGGWLQYRKRLPNEAIFPRRDV